MSLEQAIHERWSNYRPLADLVPVARVFTGQAQGPMVYPYVTLQRRPAAASTRTSSGTFVERAAVRLSIWDDNLDRAKAIADQVFAHFNRAAFDGPQVKILDVRRASYLEQQQTDGVWRVESDYRALITPT